MSSHQLGTTIREPQTTRAHANRGSTPPTPRSEQSVTSKHLSTATTTTNKHATTNPPLPSASIRAPGGVAAEPSCRAAGSCAGVAAAAVACCGGGRRASFWLWVCSAAWLSGIGELLVLLELPPGALEGLQRPRHARMRAAGRGLGEGGRRPQFRRRRIGPGVRLLEPSIAETCQHPAPTRR